MSFILIYSGFSLRLLIYVKPGLNDAWRAHQQVKRKEFIKNLLKRIKMAEPRVI